MNKAVLSWYLSIYQNITWETLCTFITYIYDITLSVWGNKNYESMGGWMINRQTEHLYSKLVQYIIIISQLYSKMQLDVWNFLYALQQTYLKKFETA